MENHGLIRSPSKFGGVVPFVVRNSGDWTQWLPAGERQSNNNTDTMACVSFSLINCIETQEKFLTGKTVNYSDRWLAKISGTTVWGNYLVSVAEAIKTYGLVREETWPTPPNYTWGGYYAEPNPAERQILLAEGAQWLKTHKFEYEFTSTTLSDILMYIKQCPLQVCIPGHAIENFYTQQEIVNYLDTYNPFQKQTARSSLTDVFKPVLTMKTMRFVNDNGTIWLVGSKGKVGFTDMQALNAIQAIDDAQIENGSVTGIPTVGLFESGLTFHK